jgi:hypothetical protein
MSMHTTLETTAARHPAQRQQRPHHFPRAARTALAVGLLLAVASAATWAQPKTGGHQHSHQHAAQAPHQHGLVMLDVALDGAQLQINLTAPLDSLLGFERAPRTAAERQAATQLLARLQDGASLLQPDAAAGCTLVEAQVDAPVLQAPAPGANATAKPANTQPADDGHAELSASYRFNCSQPAALRQLTHGLFAQFKRVQQVQAQVAGPQGQSRQLLKRPANQLRLAR